MTSVHSFSGGAFVPPRASSAALSLPPRRDLITGRRRVTDSFTPKTRSSPEGEGGGCRAPPPAAERFYCFTVTAGPRSVKVTGGLSARGQLGVIAVTVVAAAASP